MARRRKRIFRKLWRSVARKLPTHLRLALGIRLKRRSKPKEIKKQLNIGKEMDHGTDA